MCYYGFHGACSIIANESLHKHSFSQMATQAASKRSNNSGWLKTAENHIVQPNLVGGILYHGIPTPLKNAGVQWSSSVGMMKFPIVMEKSSIHVPKHQPAIHIPLPEG
jgi:hypothetical protein